MEELIGGSIAFILLNFTATFTVALIVPACFLWGAAGAHIADIVATGNLASHNAGTVLYTDILIPIVGFALWTASYVTRERSEPASQSPGSLEASRPA